MAIAARDTTIAVRDDTIVARDATIAQLEQHNRLLAKLVFGKSSEQRLPAPADLSLQGNLFLAEIAAEAQRLAEQHAVVATVEVPAHTRTKHKRRGEFPAHLPVVRTVCELKDEDLQGLSPEAVTAHQPARNDMVPRRCVRRHGKLTR